MSNQRGAIDDNGPAAQFYLLGPIDFPQVTELRKRIAADFLLRATDEICVLICEHTHVISIGRCGSRRDIHLTDDELSQRQLDIRWENRGGSCVLHQEGQLAIYPILSLRHCGWTVGEFLRRLHRGIGAVLDSFQIAYFTSNDCFAHWGRSGLLSVMGVSVQNWVTGHGLWLNVNPQMNNFRLVDSVTASSVSLRDDLVAPGSVTHSRRGGPITDVAAKSTMGSLAAECRAPITMPSVRAAAVPLLAEAFERPRYYLHSGHPFLRRSSGAICESTARAG